MSLTYYRRRVERLSKLIDLKLGELKHALNMYDKTKKYDTKVQIKYRKENKLKIRCKQQRYEQMKRRSKYEPNKYSLHRKIQTKKS